MTPTQHSEPQRPQPQQQPERERPERGGQPQPERERPDRGGQPQPDRDDPTRPQRQEPRPPQHAPEPARKPGGQPAGARRLAAAAAALALVFSFGPAGVPAAQAADGEAAESSGQPVTDTWITTKVKAELATTDGVKSMDVGVRTVDGVVTLTGVLASDIAVKKAVAAAGSVKGVKQVDASGLKSKG